MACDIFPQKFRSKIHSSGNFTVYTAFKNRIPRFISELQVVVVSAILCFNIKIPCLKKSQKFLDTGFKIF